MVCASSAESNLEANFPSLHHRKEGWPKAGVVFQSDC
jgi:hypothetical protein